MAVTSKRENFPAPLQSYRTTVVNAARNQPECRHAVRDRTLKCANSDRQTYVQVKYLECV